MSNCVKIIVGTMAKGKDIMLKIAVIDDEEYYMNSSPTVLPLTDGKRTHRGEIDCFDHADDFKTQIENGRCYDIYFMDIEMPDISGMELASYVRMKYDSPFIVFVTAHMEYSVKCYSLSCLAVHNKGQYTNTDTGDHGFAHSAVP